MSESAKPLGTESESSSEARELPLVPAAELLRLLTSHDEQAVARRLLTAVREATGVDVSYIGWSTGEDIATITLADGLLTDSMRGLELRSGRGLGGMVLADRRPHMSRDYPADTSYTSDYQAAVRPEHIHAALGVPIFAGDRMEGVLFLAKRAQSAFADSVVDAAVSAAEQVGLAFLLAERARRDAELAVAEERRRVAVALHDSVGALLFSIRASARALQDQFAQDEVGRAEAELIGRHAGEAATALHTSLQALHATATEIALGVRLREEAQHFAQRSGVRARAIFTTDVPALHAARVQTLVDVVREALRNVEKHAQARSVMVTVFADEAMVNLLVADDGIGFEGKSPAVGSGLGLGVASDALERLGGCLTVEQNVDGGTTVRARIPV